MEEQELDVWYQVSNLFIDQEGKEYYTDDWNEEEQRIEIKQSNRAFVYHERIRKATLDFAEQMATTLIIDEKRYDMLLNYDENQDVIKNLKLKEIRVANIRYEDVSDSTFKGVLNEILWMRYKYD